MHIKLRIKAFVSIGSFIYNYFKWLENPENYAASEVEKFEKLNEAVNYSFHHNGWFTRKMVLEALKGISVFLNEKELNEFVEKYNVDNKNPKSIALILAGNIPMVGFHDVLCVILSGNKALIKVSSQDTLLLTFLLNNAAQLNPGFGDCFEFTQRKMENFDAIIATGSDNSSRYFDYYFGKYPHIIRKNRNSIAIISGQESEENLGKLGDDIFTYYGLGCRNVSKIYVPKNYDLNKIFKAIFPFVWVLDNKKYYNNYEYYQTLYMLNKAELLQNGFINFKEDSGIASPIGVLFYEYYENLNQLLEDLETKKEKIQCVVSEMSEIKNSVKMGETQKPTLTDFADGVDTMLFLKTL